MPPGRKQLRRIQIAKEVTPGTPVPATTRLRFPGVLKDLRTVEEIAEDIGILGGLDRTTIPKIFAGIDIPDSQVSYQQIQYFLAMGFGGPTTGAADGVGTDKIYTTNIPTTTIPTLVTYTFEGGDDHEVEIMEYGYCTKLHFGGKAGEGLKMGASLNGRQVQHFAAFTGALAISAVDDVLVSLGKVYLEAIGGVYGTTQVTNAILGLDISFEMMVIPKFTADGVLYFSYVVYAGQKITGKLTFEHDAAVDGVSAGVGGAKFAWRAQTALKLRLKFEGAAVVTGGTTYQKNTFIIDLPIKWKLAGGLEDQNGNDIITMDFTSRYNLTSAEAGKFIVVHEVSPLP